MCIQETSKRGGGFPKFAATASGEAMQRRTNEGRHTYPIGPLLNRPGPINSLPNQTLQRGEVQVQVIIGQVAIMGYCFGL